MPYLIFSQTTENAPVEAPAVDSPATTDETAASPETPAAPALPGTEASRAREEALNFFDDTPSGNTDATTDAVPAPRGPSTAFVIFRMVLVLALVALCIYLAVYFLRRLGKPQTEQNPHLKILASVHLGNGRYVHVISVGKNAYLVGSGEGGVSHIADLADQETVDAMILDASQKSAEAPGFMNFQSLIKKFSGGLSSKEQNRLENMRRRREKFKRF